MGVYGAQDWSKVYGALADDHRREILRHLTRETVGPVKTDLLAGDITDATTDPSDTALVDLYHVHLPKLTEANLVTWNRADDVVVPTSFARQAPSLLYEPAQTVGTVLDGRVEHTDD